jgi:hypothetical protein
MRTLLFLGLGLLVVYNATIAFRGPNSLSVLFGSLTLFYTLYVPVIIVRHALSSPRVDHNVIMGALCAYILLGVAWGAGYAMLETHSPGSFQAPGAQPVRQSLVYFSFVTLTTLGYGDITPVAGIARFLSVLEALFGQVYLVVLVAKLVGLHIQHTSQGNTSD